MLTITYQMYTNAKNIMYSYKELNAYSEYDDAVTLARNVIMAYEQQLELGKCHRAPTVCRNTLSMARPRHMS